MRPPPPFCHSGLVGVDFGLTAPRLRTVGGIGHGWTGVVWARDGLDFLPSPGPLSAEPRRQRFLEPRSPALRFCSEEAQSMLMGKV